METDRVRQNALDQTDDAQLGREKGVVLALIYIGDAILKLAYVIDGEGNIH